jgi:hypothetical protein
VRVQEGPFGRQVFDQIGHGTAAVVIPRTKQMDALELGVSTLMN